MNYKVNSQGLPRTEPIVADDVSDHTGPKNYLCLCGIGGSFDMLELTIKKPRQRATNRYFIVDNKRHVLAENPHDIRRVVVSGESSDLINDTD